MTHNSDSPPPPDRDPPVDPVGSFRGIFDIAPVGVVRSTVGGELLYVNATLVEMMGFRSSAEMQQSNAAVRYKDPADRARMIELLRADGFVQSFEATVLTRDGAERTVLSSVTLEGTLLTSIVVDITARKRAERTVATQTARLEVLADASRAFAEAGVDEQTVLNQVARTIAERLDSGCNIHLISEDGQWLKLMGGHNVDLDMARHMEQTLAATPIHVDEPGFVSRVVRTGQALLVPVIDLAQLRASLTPERQALLDSIPVHSIVGAPLRVHGQTIGMLLLGRHRAAQPAFTADDQSLVQELAERAALAIGNARLFKQLGLELAERERAEAALEAERALLSQRVAERTADLRAANAELSAALRLKDEFLATMSHELRTPLNAIMGRSELLAEQYAEPLSPRQAKAVRAIHESGTHLLSLINDILDLSQLEARTITLERSRIEIDRLCRASLQRVAPAAAAKQIALSVTLDSLVETLDADEQRLRQLLSNLLENAVKFTPDGGTVSLEVCGDPHRNTVTFTVADTGIGIAAADLPLLFQPFTQLDAGLNRQHTGTGLGLALVRRLTEAHGGTVAVESTPGHGSRFRVMLPWTSAEAPQTAPPASLAPEQPAPYTHGTTMPRILLAEDNQANIDVMLDYLEAKGFAVTVARDGHEAIRVVAAAQPDLVLMDIQMPGMDGIEATRRIRAEPSLRGLPIIALTALAMPGDRERCLQAGADEYLTKPVDLRALNALIGSLLQRRGTRA